MSKQQVVYFDVDCFQLLNLFENVKKKEIVKEKKKKKKDINEKKADKTGEALFKAIVKKDFEEVDQILSKHLKVVKEKENKNLTNKECIIGTVNISNNAKFGDTKEKKCSANESLHFAIIDSKKYLIDNGYNIFNNEKNKDGSADIGYITKEGHEKLKISTLELKNEFSTWVKYSHSSKEGETTQKALSELTLNQDSHHEHPHIVDVSGGIIEHPSI